MTSIPSAPGDTALAGQLRDLIKRSGPVPVADFMRICLLDPEHGYYMTRPVIGAAADFVTAPEISQVFGELAGLWCAAAWRVMGEPSNLALIELGPGRGTLMRDALRAVRIMPDFRAALHVHLVETCAPLYDAQHELLQSEPVPITWHRDLAAALSDGSIAPGPTIIIANEFLDALPVEQVIYASGEWRQRGVTARQDGTLEFCVMGPPPDFELPNALFGHPAEGSIFEFRPQFESLAATLSKRAASTPLAALFIDYGHMSSGFGDTLQAVNRHRTVSPFFAPGQTDLTAHVDFAALANAARRHDLAVDGPVTQSGFLGSLGIMQRASRLMAANPERAALIETGVARLMAPGGMGSQFKVIGLRRRVDSLFGGPG